MNSNLSFHEFLPTFNWTQYKMRMSAKGPAYFQVISCYFIDVRLKLLCVKFAWNWTNTKKKRGIPKAISSWLSWMIEQKLLYLWKCSGKRFLSLEILFLDVVFMFSFSLMHLFQIKHLWKTREYLLPYLDGKQCIDTLIYMVNSYSSCNFWVNNFFLYTSMIFLTV